VYTEDVAWYDAVNTIQTGQKQPNALGIRDMSGNVREYTATRDGAHVIVRGGSALSASVPLSASVVMGMGQANDVTGFRIVRQLREIPQADRVLALTPVSGALGVTSIDKPTYTAGIAWTPALTNNRFAGQTAYSAVITIVPKNRVRVSRSDGWTVQDSVTNVWDVQDNKVSVTYAATGLGGAISGLTAPVAGATADTSIDNAGAYTASSVIWSPALDPGNKHRANTAYTAAVTLSATSGNTFAGVGANSFSVPGASSVVTEVHSSTQATVTISYGATDQTVTELNLEIAPLVKTVPQTSLALGAGSDYTNVSVAWSGSTLDSQGRFRPNAAHTATVTVTPKAGKTVYGLPANSFRVNGTKVGVVHAAGSNTFTVSLNTTGTASIDTVLSGLQPVVGAQPITTINQDTYTASVTWDPAIPAGGFQSNTGYVATVTVTPKAGYTLTGVGANSMTATGAMVTHGAGNGATLAVTANLGIGITAPLAHRKHTAGSRK
jgi:hypothetical protein